MYKLLKKIYNSIKGVGRMKKTYTIIVHKEEDGYWAECKEFKECFAQAKTLEELKALMRQSIYLNFDELEKNNGNQEEQINDINLEVSYA